ncbi:sugar-transfer associated ATP-grasp domain-containing protein [uncultured Tateyamaria sp.]|uniref:sugar-transfer associated ATP-grasp domain-containing protein n=1 Tax=uncultured Tateyamaria sp. TaxID=455651 RepID=UPI00260FA526|nr:sugar-transfer associated ATP-grasp domain-containing protein [uncultured Tateyamaria sp.]
MEIATKGLLAAPQDPTPAAAETMVAIARQFGIGPLRQLREMMMLRWGPGKLASHEYVSTGAYAPDLTVAEKKTYVGKIGSYELNVAASPMALTGTRAFLRDKVMYTALLRQLGFATTDTQAVVHADRMFGDLPVLRSVDDVVAFLRDDAVYPLFAKPCEGAGSVGSALIEGREGDMLRLAKGQMIDLAAFATEIVDDYPEGFILQSAVQQHADMAAMTGAAVGTLRVVTTRDDTGIAPLYTVWKIPSPRAMSDNFWQSGSMVALIDDDSGQVRRCNIGSGPAAEWLDHHPVTQLPFAGHQIPHWDKVIDTATRAHGLFPEFGLVGWDIAVGPDGPVIIECNDNPFHVLWQLAAGQGIRNDRFMPRFDAAAARSEAILRGRVNTFRARQSAKAAKS